MCELGRRVRRGGGPNRGRGGSYRRGRGKEPSVGWVGMGCWCPSYRNPRRPGGRGEEGAPASGRARVGSCRAPPRGKGRGPRGWGLPATPPPPCTQRGPGSPLPAGAAAEPARGLGAPPRSLPPGRGLWFPGVPAGLVWPVTRGGGEGARIRSSPTSAPAGGRPEPPPSPEPLPPLTLQSTRSQPPGRLGQANAMATGPPGPCC